jgi:hypothetical protein
MRCGLVRGRRGTCGAGLLHLVRHLAVVLPLLDGDLADERAEVQFFRIADRADAGREAEIGKRTLRNLLRGRVGMHDVEIVENLAVRKLAIDDFISELEAGAVALVVDVALDDLEQVIASRERRIFAALVGGDFVRVEGVAEICHDSLLRRGGEIRGERGKAFAARIHHLVGNAEAVLRDKGRTGRGVDPAIAAAVRTGALGTHFAVLGLDRHVLIHKQDHVHFVLKQRESALVQPDIKAAVGCRHRIVHRVDRRMRDEHDIDAPVAAQRVGGVDDLAPESIGRDVALAVSRRFDDAQLFSAHVAAQTIGSSLSRLSMTTVLRSCSSV